jgi:CRP/FNR family transcriptional regulator
MKKAEVSAIERERAAHSAQPSPAMRARSYCDKCAVRDQALCSVIPEEVASALSRMAHFRRIPAGRVIHGDDQDLSWLAVIVAGVVKLVKAQHDGRQQIVGLQFASDFLGRLHASRSPVIAEATTNLELCCFSKSAFEQLMREHPSLERVLHRRALDDLDASREWMFLLGRKTARERVASLLSLIARRMARAYSGRTNVNMPLEFDLPLSRVEMADSLGLTTETVSREFRYLKSRGIIATRGRRHVSVSNLAALKSVAESQQD